MVATSEFLSENYILVLF